MGLWFVAGAAILFTAGAVAGIGRGEPVCERSSEAPRPLDLLRADAAENQPISFGLQDQHERLDSPI